MAWTPISGTVPQYQKSDGTLASDYYIKFYQSGTTTAFSMATDSTGGSTLDKAKINSSGYPVNGSDAVFIPHVNQTYKIVLYKNATDADNDNTANADWVVDNIEQFQAGTGTIDASNVSYTPAGTGAVATNVQAKLRERISIRDFGADPTGVSDSYTAINNALTYASTVYPEGSTVEMGSGKFVISQELVIPERVTLIGNGFSQASSASTENAPTIISKSGNHTGVRLKAYSTLKNVHVLGESGNGGNGIDLRGRGGVLDTVSSTGHGGVGVRVGDSSGTNTNLWRAYNVICRDNTSHGFYANGTAVSPDVNVGMLIGYEGRDNGGDALAIENCIDCTWINIQSFENTGYGIRLYSGAKGNWFSTTYSELDGGGSDHGRIDSGAERNYILGRSQGSGNWEINDQNNFFLGNGSQPFIETLTRVAGYIQNGAGSDQDYKESVDTDRLIIESMESGKSFTSRMFTADGDGTDSVQQEFYGVGTSTASSNRERMVIGYNSSTQEFELKSNASGTGTNRNLRIESGGAGTNELVFQTNDVMFNVPEGIGDGSNVNIQAPAIGTGGGPSTMTVAKWIRVKVESDGQRYYIPLFQ